MNCIKISVATLKKLQEPEHKNQQPKPRNAYYIEAGIFKHLENNLDQTLRWLYARTSGTEPWSNKPEVWLLVIKQYGKQLLKTKWFISLLFVGSVKHCNISILLFILSRYQRAST